MRLTPKAHEMMQHIADQYAAADFPNYRAWIFPRPEGDTAFPELVAQKLIERNGGGGAAPFRLTSLGQTWAMERRNLPEGDDGVDDAEADKSLVFIIHGRNVAARNAMEQFVRGLGLQVLDFDQVAAGLGGTPFIGDIVRDGMKRARGIIALFTPDEYSALRPDLRNQPPKKDDLPRWQSRPNVIFEAGMAYGIAPQRTALVTLGDEVELFSDVTGIHLVRLDNTSDSRGCLRQKLIGMKCAVDQEVNAWIDPARSGDFEACVLVGEVKPRDPFGIEGQDRGPHSAPTDGDARILLTSWVNQLSDLRAGQAFEYTKIASEARVSVEQTRQLLPKLLRRSGTRLPGWSVGEVGETVIILNHSDYG